MKVGDLVKGAYDKNKHRTGIVLRITTREPYREWGECVEVLWNTTPMGLDQKGIAWTIDLEVISEAR